MNIFDYLQAIILGIVQGITEWLPISSTGHMILVNEFLRMPVTQSFKDFMELFLVVVQFGSILAVLVLYFHKLNPFSKKKEAREKKETFSLWGKVIVAAIPGAVIGFLFDDLISSKLQTPLVVAIALIVYGVAFIVIENRNKKPKIKGLSQLSYQTAFLIGVFQVLALIPGTSRSGSTILGAVLLGASRYVAAEFSFFLAIPMMVGASGYKILKFVLQGHSFTSGEWGILLVGMVVAFVVSVLAIKFLMSYIKKHDFKAFGWYRIVLGILVILYFLFAGKMFASVAG
ncbi:MAG: undecaprenyl-diphosphate phosphatase [Clostridiales bacterium]|jgi:undecaprenyl-diphosphatase|nr:undecaprenyl-diphosphate phosphatase [Clostridiales bacterium]